MFTFRDRFVLINLVIVLCPAAGNIDHASPKVFDPMFYANSNHRIIDQGANTIQKVRQHWLTYGMKAGLRGSGDFHSKQYLKRYPDLQKAFGTNYVAAVEHYLIHHRTERRLGLLPPDNHGYDGRWTISKNGFYISSSTRTAGAIDSLTWNNKEFINSWDHGRQMQMACNTNGYGECYNPTEAGGSCDGVKDTTHSSLDWIHLQSNVMETQSHPAFWKPVKPSSGTAYDCNYGNPCPIRTGYWTQYTHTFSKKITIGSNDISNCVEFISNFTIAGNWPQDGRYVQMEAPALYLTYEFTEAFTFNPQTRLAEAYHSLHLPVILSTKDHQYAIGAYAPRGQDTDILEQYHKHYFKFSVFVNSTGKLNVVFLKRPHGTSSRNYVYRVYICIGTLNMVTDCLHQIMTFVPR